MQINYENALRFLDTYFDTYDNHIGRQCWQLIRNKAEAQPQADNKPLNAIALCKRAVFHAETIGSIQLGHPIIDDMRECIAQQQ